MSLFESNFSPPRTGALPLPGDDEPMRIARYDLRPVWIIVLAALLLAGCSSLSRKTPDPEDLAAMAEARMVLLALGNQNDKLTNFKGIGKIKVWQKGKKRIDERIAWIGSPPGDHRTQI